MPQNDFMKDFKAVYEQNGKHDLKAQIPFLAKLAEKYKNRGKKDPRKRWTDILKVRLGESFANDQNSYWFHV